MTGKLYSLVTLALPLLLSLLFLWLAMPFAWLDLALIVPYFLAFNLIEYLLHRWPMHRPGTALYEHVTVHHHAFPPSHLYITEDRDNFSVVVPAYVCIGLLAAMAPIGFTIGIHAGFFLLGIGMAYYFVYELLHYAAHAGVRSRFARHHLAHHQIAGCNYNINFPILDWVVGTLADTRSC